VVQQHQLACELSISCRNKEKGQNTPSFTTNNNKQQPKQNNNNNATQRTSASFKPEPMGPTKG